MAQPYVGEIRMFGGNFAPLGWQFCSGQLLAISNYEVLFTLIGTTYGGDGVNTFALPNLQSRVPLHMGSSGGINYSIGQQGGVETVTLSGTQLPAHTHAIVADAAAGTSGDPTNRYFANAAPALTYSVPNSTSNPDPTVLRAMNAAMLTTIGGNQPHSNLQPFVAVSFIISLFGIFPSRS